MEHRIFLQRSCVRPFRALFSSLARRDFRCRLSIASRLPPIMALATVVHTIRPFAFPPSIVIFASSLYRFASPILIVAQIEFSIWVRAKRQYSYSSGKFLLHFPSTRVNFRISSQFSMIHFVLLDFPKFFALPFLHHHLRRHIHGWHWLSAMQCIIRMDDRHRHKHKKPIRLMNIYIYAVLREGNYSSSFLRIHFQFIHFSAIFLCPRCSYNDRCCYIQIWLFVMRFFFSSRQYFQAQKSEYSCWNRMSLISALCPTPFVAVWNSTTLKCSSVCPCSTIAYSICTIFVQVCFSWGELYACNAFVCITRSNVLVHTDGVREQNGDRTPAS